MATSRDVLGRGRVQQRHPRRTSIRSSARRTRATDMAASIVNPVKPDSFMRRKGSCRSVTALPAGRRCRRPTCFRVFERGGARRLGTQFPEIGLPNSSGALQKLDEPGRPDIRQSSRGPRHRQPHRGAGHQHPQDALERPAPLVPRHERPARRLSLLGLHRLPRDLRERPGRDAFGHRTRASAMTARAPRATRRSRGTRRGIRSATSSRARFPSSQCMVCHMHQPNVVREQLLRDHHVGLRDPMRPRCGRKKQKYPTDEEAHRILERNPEEAAIRGKWGDPAFLRDVSKLNPQLKDTQFADYHGHGWNFREVFKRDRRGALLDKDGKIVSDDDPAKFKKSRAPHLDPPRHGNPLRRLPLRPGRARQRPHLRRGPGGDRDRLRRLPRHGRQVPDASHDGPRVAPRRHRHVAPAHAGRAQALRVARRQALPALGARRRAANGR